MHEEGGCCVVVMVAWDVLHAKKILQFGALKRKLLITLCCAVER